MKDSERIGLIIDGEGVFGDFGNSEWVKRMLKKAEQADEQRGRKESEKRPKVETAQGQ